MRRIRPFAVLVRLVLFALAALALAPRAATAQTQQLIFDRIFDDRSRPQASGWSWRPDGRMLTCLWREGKERELRGYDPATGKLTWSLPYATLPFPAQAAGASGEGSGLPPGFGSPGFTWSPAGDAILFDERGDLYLYRLSTKSFRRLTDSPADEKSATFSPDGQRLAFVRDHDLYALDLATGLESRLTTDGREDEILNGETSWIYWEEIWGRRPEAFWWSPDGTRLAYYRFDERAMERYPLEDDRPLYPKVTWQRYPKAGERNPDVSVRVMDLATRATHALPLGDAQAFYFARVHWRPDGTKVALERLNREQTELELLLCDPKAADGAGCEAIAKQSHPTWVNLNDDFHFLADGGFVWSTEASGWKALERYDAKGTRTATLTPDGWALDRVVELREGAGDLIATGFRIGGLGAAERQVMRLPLDGSAPQLLAGEPGMNGASPSPKTPYFVHSWSRANDPGGSALRKLSGEKVMDLPGQVAPWFDAAALPQVEFLEIPGPNGVKLPAMLTKPAGFDAAKSYPVLMYHYGGPGSQVVMNGWGRQRGLWQKLMAERGCVIFSVDNEASAFFGKAGEDRIHRNFGPLELAGQLAGVDYLKSLPWVDATRIGLWGWSGGGANTLWSLFHAPGVWRAGMAGAPVSDWRLYDSVWTERYMGTPQSNPEGYKTGSAVTAAKELKDHLLIVHGTGDDNVHPQNTMAVIDALVAAGIPFEQALYPREKHGFKPAASKHFYARMMEFFERELGTPR